MHRSAALGSTRHIRPVPKEEPCPAPSTSSCRPRTPERAARFYTEVFGWEIEMWDGPVEYWLVTTGEEGQPGINGAIMRAQQPEQTTTNTVDVEDLDATVARATAAGATVVVPRMPIPGMGFLAYLTDTEGNTFGMMEVDSNAA